MFRTSFSSHFNKPSIQSSSRKNDFKGKRSDDRSKNPEQTSLKFSASTKCYRCQDYGHIAANGSSEMKIIFVNGAPIQAPESHITQTEMKTTIPIMSRKVLMVNITIFNSHLQITYLSSSMSSHKRRTIGEELLSFTHSLRLEIRIEK